MRNQAEPRLPLRRAAALLALGLALGGCAGVPTVVESEDEPLVTAPAEPAVTPTAPSPGPPPPPAPRPRAPTPSRADIVVIVDASAPSYAETADALTAALPPQRYRITRFTSATLDAELTTPATARAAAIVAVGAAAVARARAALPGKPIVFCQVLAADPLLAAGDAIWGVDALPPLALQLESWQTVDPGLRTVALIVSSLDTGLARAARAAAAATSADLRIEASSSDRETLYLFRRLAAEVDGLWLLPDNAALSPSTLRELLRFAATRGIGVLTFNNALLTRGALLSAMSVPDDVAATVARVLERVVAGRTAELPGLTPLSAAALEINRDVATTLGLAPTAEPRWVSREAD